MSPKDFFAHRKQLPGKGDGQTPIQPVGKAREGIPRLWNFQAHVGSSVCGLQFWPQKKKKKKKS